MTSYRDTLTPQMGQYAERFDDRAEIRWMPYLMYFHPVDHRSAVVNTDGLGFRLAQGPGATASAGSQVPGGPVNLVAGSSTVFGIGASSDANTLASRLWDLYGADRPWLNFGGRSHNSTQELLLFTLYRHLVPQIDRIVLFSGFNDLGLARLPRWMQGDDGAFFNCREYYEQLDELRIKQRRAAGLSRRHARRVLERTAEDLAVPDLDEQIGAAVERTTRHLENWRLLADGLGARLTFVLQPLAPWVREKPAPEEELIFAELDEIADFGQAYGDIARLEVGRRYAAELSAGCQKLGVPFVDMNPLLGRATGPADWLFVDRIHFTDHGHDVVARLLRSHLED